MSLKSWLRQLTRPGKNFQASRRKQKVYHAQAEPLENRTLLSSVSGRVFDDRLQDGLQPEEDGIQGYPVSLVDSDGNTVRDTLTDSNGDYTFADVAAGTYVVSFGTVLSQFGYTTADAGNDDAVDSDVLPELGTTPSFTVTGDGPNFDFDAGVLRSGSAQQRALVLDQTLNLKKGRFDDFINAFGVDEKWVKSELHNEGSQWLYILPDGSVHAWDGTSGVASGPLVASFGSEIYENPALLHYASGNAELTPNAGPAQTAYELDQSLDLYTVGHWAESYGGLGLKWMAGRRNEFGNPWYFVTPQGRFHAWDGQDSAATGTLLARLPSSYFDDATLLTNPQRPVDSITPAVQAGLLREAFHLWLPDAAPDGFDENSGPWFRGDRNEFANTWYFLDATGAFYAWDGSASQTGQQIAQLDTTFVETPTLLAFADFYVDDLSAAQTAFDLDRQYQLRSTGHYFENWAGAGEKWVAGRPNADGDQWYFILPNGEFYKLEGRGRELGGRLLATLPTEYYDEPHLLHLAFPETAPPESPGIVGLSERDDFLTEFFVPVQIGADEGTNTLAIDISGDLDIGDSRSAVGDVFQVYVVDENNASTTLLDNGIPGTPVFTLGESWFELAPGIAQYDGRTISIATESLPGGTNAILRFQLLNGDRDTGSQVDVLSVSVSPSKNGTPTVPVTSDDSAAVPGDALDTDAFVSVSDVNVSVENPRYDPTTGAYAAELQIVNFGTETHREIVVAFPELPNTVTLSSASGTDSGGNPYVNLSGAVPLGGLFSMGRSAPVQITFDNPGALRFLQEPVVFVSPSNTAPTLQSIAPQTIVPGEVLALPLIGDDADGNPLSYFLDSDMPLPTGEQDGNMLYFAPSPQEIGAYEFDAVVTDGISEARQTIQLNVVADTVSTTRVRGIVQDVDQQPLAGIRVTIGALETFTNTEGVFFFETTGSLPDDTVRIHANELTGDNVYPFIAERLSLVLEHEVYEGALNDIERPIYLPVLDVAGGSEIDPSQTTVVEQEIASGEMASVTVAAGTLKDQSGNDFTGTLSITEVPRDLTPAALPEELIPDVVVTIQPGEMNFTEPAPLTMPNRAGYFPGEEMDLWSINPVTGDFDIVGTGRVTDDGTQIETIEGGIRNSSWHMFIRRLVERLRSLRDPKNERRDCTICPKSMEQTDSDGSSNSQGGAQTLVPDGSVSGSPVRPRYNPGANPFSQVRLPPGIDLNFPSFDFAGELGGTAPSVSDPTLDSLTAGLSSATSGLSNPFGFGIQMPTSTRIGSNVIHSGGFLNSPPASPLDAAAAPINNSSGGTLDLTSATILAGGPATQFTTSEVELHSGSQIENHQLVTYHSLGADRGLSFTYDSRRADPVHLTYMGVDNARGGAGRLLTGGVELLRGNFQGSKDALPPTPSEPNLHYRKVSNGTQNVEIPVPVDLTSTPSGVYDIKTTAGLVQSRGNTISGRTTIRDDEIVTVNTIDSPYGAGWGIDGLIEVKEMADGRVLWINGDGRQFRYRPSANQTGSGVRYDNAPGDFSVFEKLPNGRFRNTSKFGTVSNFNDRNLLESITDRNGNVTRYEYDDAGRLTKMIDPVGMETTLAYSVFGHLSSVTDPAGRTTRFEHDANGNLTRITDPDDTFRTFGYDGRHHLISEVDKRGNREEVRYDELGRVSESIRRDLSTLKLDTVQSAPSELSKSKSISAAPVAERLKAPEASFVDANGNTTMTSVDAIGLVTGRSDDEGPLPTFVRDGNNLVLRQTDGRGNVTLYTYDDRGNLLTMQDQIARDASQLPQFEASFHEPIFAMTSPGSALLDAADIDGDGDVDFVSTDGQRILGNGDGSMVLDTSDTFASTDFLRLLDMNEDGAADWVYGRNDTLFIDLNDGNGNRTASDSIDLNPPSGHRIHQFRSGDFDGNGTLDLFVLFKAASGTAGSGFAFVPGNGDGTFGAATVTADSRSLPFGASLAALDYDNDGDLDPLLAFGAVVLPMQNDGNGNFTAQASVAGDGNSLGFTELVVTDLNNDGLDDLLMSRITTDVLQALNNGDGTFATSIVVTQNNRQITEMAVGDLNGDQLEDVVVGFEDQRVSVVYAQTDGTWSDPVASQTAGDPNEILLADLDNDGDLDLLTRSTHVDQVGVKLNPGDGSFGGRALSSFFDPDSGAGRARVQFADGNGDGIPDIFSNQPSTNGSFLTFIPGQGDGTFGEVVRTNTDIDRSDGLAIGDLDSDGDMDAVVTGGFGHGYSVVIGNGDGTFQPATHVNQGGNLSSPLLIDINDDGNLDLLEAQGRVLSALGNGDGTFQPFDEVFDFSGAYDDLAAGDYNNDGNLDLVTSVGSGNPGYHFFAGNGDGSFQDVVSIDPGSVGGDEVQLIDLNEDGNLDLVGYGAGRLTVLLGDGAGGFTTAQNANVGGGGHEYLIAANVDNDDGIEILVTDSANTRMRVFQPNGDGTYNTSPESFRAMQGVAGIDLADIDSDGDLDVAFSGLSFDNNNAVNTLLNRSIEPNSCDGPCRVINTYEPTFNQLTSTTDELGRQTLFEIDPTNGNTLSIRRVLGTHDGDTIVDDLLTQFTWTSQGLIETITDPLGRVVRYEYDQFGRETRKIMAVGTTVEADVRTEYDAAGNVTAVIDENDNRTQLTYDELNRVTDITNALNDAVTLAYDENGNVTSTNDLNGNVTRTVYDEMDRPVSMIDAVGAEITLEYDEQGNLSRTIDRLGRQTEFRYDKRNRLTETVNAEGGVMSYEYDFDNNIVAMTDENGNRTQYRYDARNRQTAVIDALGGITNSNFDVVNNLRSTSDELDRTTTFEYDDADRLITMTLPDPDLDGPDMSPIYVNQYDLASNLIATTDPLGNTTQYTFDNRDRLVEQTDPDPDGAGPLQSPRTQFTYDNALNLTSVSDPLDRVTQFEYDDIYRVIRTTLPDPDGAGSDTTPIYTSTYDAESNLLSEVDPLGNETTYTYDTRYVLTSTTGPDPDGPDGPAGHQITTFEYDAEEQLVSVSDPLQRVTQLEYDLLGRNTVTRLPDPDKDGPDTTPVITSVFDPYGNIIETIDPLGNTTRFEYDGLHRLIRQTDPDPDGPAAPLLSPVTEITYDAADQLLAVSDPLQRVTTFAYDELGRVHTITEPDPDRDGPDTSPVTTYVYDLVDNELSMTDPLGNVTQYEYDNLYRLTRQINTDPDGAGPLLSPEWDFEYDIASQMLSQSDPLDRTTRYEHDDLGRISRVTEPDPDRDGPDTSPVTTYVYDLVDNELSMTDPLGNVTQYEYDNLYRLTRRIDSDPDGAGPLLSPEWDFEYDIANQMLSQSDPLDRTTTWDYDDLGRVVRTTAPDPDKDGPDGTPITTYVYDLANNQRSMTDPLGNVTDYDYDNLYRLTSVTEEDPDGDTGPADHPVSRYTYDIASQMTSSTDPLGRITSFDYDDLSRVVRVTEPDPDKNGPLTSPVTTYVYDLVDNELSMTDSLGNVTEYEYDNLYRLVRQIDTDPDGSAGPLQSPIWNYVYDVASQLTSVSDPLDRTTTYDYDDLSRVVTVTEPDPDKDGPLTAPVMTYVYDLVDNELSMTDSLGNVTEYEYDNLYRLTHRVDSDPDGPGLPLQSPVTEYEYDVASQLTSMTDPLQRTTTYAWDDLGRRSEEVYPDPDLDGPGQSPRMTYTFDLIGNVLTDTDGLGHTRTFTYDNLYRRITDTDANGDTTEFQYDLIDNLLSLTDPVQNMTSWDYDDLNRVIREVNPLNDVQTFAYDSEDNLIRKVDRNGRPTEYEYDNLYRQTGEIWLDGSNQEVHRFTYTYDVASQMLTAIDAFDAMTYVYDDLGRVTQKSYDITGLDPVITFHQTFDSEDNRLSLSAVIGTTDDFVTQYTYDNLYRPTSVGQASSLSTSANNVAEKRLDFTWDIASQRTSATRHADLAGTQTVVTTSYAYDRDSRITDIDHRKGTTDLAGYDVTWDAGNRITRWASLTDGAVDYNYDDRNQLTGADYDFQADESYQYDENGNRIGGSHQTGPANRLAEDETYTYEYDPEGNRTRRVHKTTGEVTEYEWDHRNRLTRITTRSVSEGPATQIVEHSYDANNRWIRRRVDSDGTGAATFDDTFFIQDGNNIVLEFDGTTDADISHRYLWGTGIDEIMADENALGDVLWPLTDHLGTVRDLASFDTASDTTTIESHRTYDAFGNVVHETNAAIDTLFGFTGRPFDDATDLQNNINRWYDAKTGKWLSEDPIEFAAGDANLRRYVANSLPMSVDPDGLEQSLFWNIVGSGTQWVADRVDSAFGRGSFDSSVRQTDRVTAGFADQVTGGLSTRVRERTAGEVATQNHQGTAFRVGQALGIVYDVASGAAIAKGGARLGLRASAGLVTFGSDAYSVYQSIQNYKKGCFSGWDLLPLLSVASYVSTLRNLKAKPSALQQPFGALDDGRFYKPVHIEENWVPGPRANQFGDVFFPPRKADANLDDQFRRRVNEYHEDGHSALSPKLIIGSGDNRRIRPALQGRDHSVILNYVEEVLVESYAQVRGRIDFRKEMGKGLGQQALGTIGRVLDNTITVPLKVAWRNWQSAVNDVAAISIVATLLGAQDSNSANGADCDASHQSKRKCD